MIGLNTGLVNQMLGHVGAFLLAASLRADIVLHHALSGKIYDIPFWKQEWQKRPFGTLLGVDKMVKHCRRLGSGSIRLRMRLLFMQQYTTMPQCTSSCKLYPNHFLFALALAKSKSDHQGAFFWKRR